jgi:hypothetical protein
MGNILWFRFAVRGINIVKNGAATFSIMTHHNDIHHTDKKMQHPASLHLMLMLGDIMRNVTIKSIMLNGVILIVVMLKVVAPIKHI